MDLLRNRSKTLILLPSRYALNLICLLLVSTFHNDLNQIFLQILASRLKEKVLFLSYLLPKKNHTNTKKLYYSYLFLLKIVQL